MHNARRNQMEHKLLVTHFNSVTSVCTALETHHDICVQSQEIHNLGLTFVTPLGADYNTICHISFVLFMTHSGRLVKQEISYPERFSGTFFAYKIVKSVKRKG